MPVASSLARYKPAFTHPFAGLASAAVLALSSAPAPAQPGGQVKEPTRHDVLASCAQIQRHLERELTHTWWLRRDYGVVDVRFVVTDGQVTAVRTRSGLSFQTMGDVRRALSRLECPGAPAGTSTYRMQVVFADPEETPGGAADAQPPHRIALVEMR